MKLHLPKMLLTAVLAVCALSGNSYAGMAIPPSGNEGSTAIWTGTKWINATGGAASFPTGQYSGQYYIFNANSSVAVGRDNANTSDGGGVYVNDGVTVSDLKLGNYAGVIYVGIGSTLDAEIGASNGVLKSVDDSKANVWVDGDLTLSGLKAFGGGGKNHNWHIGENGYINLSSITALNRNSKTWNIELIQKVTPKFENVQNRTMTTTERTRTFMGTGMDLSSVVTLTVYDTEGNQLTSGTDYTTAHSASGLAITYTDVDYGKMDLTWAGGANGTWTAGTSNWQDDSGTTTTFINGDSVTFESSATVTTAGHIDADSLSVAAGSTLALNAGNGKSINVNSLNIQGELQSSTGIAISGTVSMGESAIWSLTSGAAQTLTQTQLAGVSSMTIGEGAGLKIDFITTAAGSTLDLSGKFSGNGTIALALNTEGNGNSVNLGDFAGDIEVRKGAGQTRGRLMLSGSTFHADSCIILAEAGAEIVMNTNGYTLTNDVRVDVDSQLHTNSGNNNDDPYSYTINSDISGAGTLTKVAGGKLTLQGDISASFKTAAGTTDVCGSNVTNLMATGGTTNLKSATLSIGGGTALNDTHDNGLYITGGAQVNIGDGVTASKVTVSRVEMGDSQSGSGGTLQVKAKSSLIVTNGDVISTGDSYATYHKTGFIMGEWGVSSALNVEGNLWMENTSITCGENSGIITVKNGGVVATKGLINGKDNNGSLSLTLENGGALVIGETGIVAKNLTATLAAGTIGISADTSITKAISLSSENGTTFDTTKYSWDTDGSLISGSAGGNLTISGIISDHSVTTGEGDAQTTTVSSGKLIKDGAGTLTLKASNTYTGGTEVKAGKLVAATGAALGQEGATTISGGSLEITDTKTTISQSKTGTNATMTYDTTGLQTNETGDTAYSIGNVAYKVQNARVEIASDSEQTISNKLVGVDLVNKGTKQITAGNGYNVYTSLSAEKGNIHIKSYGQNSNQGDLDSLSIGDNLIMGVHTAWQYQDENMTSHNVTITTTAAEATVSVAKNGTASFGEGAQLYANLKLSSGVTLTLDGALTMGSTLELSSGMTLKGAMLTSVSGLTEGNTVNLFESVDSLILGNATYDANNALAEGTVSLKDYFTNVTNDDIYLAFNNGNVYAGIMSIPEPTTATLSLLALAGLAARRRRK